MAHLRQSAFIVHIQADLAGNRMFVIGRLADGRSFAAVDEAWRPAALVRQTDSATAARILAEAGIEPLGTEPTAGLHSFGAEPLARIRMRRIRDFRPAVEALEARGLTVWEGDRKPAILFARDRGIGTHCIVEGEADPGRRVDLVARNPRYETATDASLPALRIAAFDFETSLEDGSIIAFSIACGTKRLAQVVLPARQALGTSDGTAGVDFEYAVHPDERSLLVAFQEALRAIDPDILTGWNIMDFDLPRLAERLAAHRLPLHLGRSDEHDRFYPGEGRQSAALHAVGRQTLDALRLMRTSGNRFDNLSLDTVATELLGRGKLVAETGDAKLARLSALYREDPIAFARYCLEDAVLVLDILAATGLVELTQHRSALTGAPLDQAWTSIASFEQLYGTALRQRSLVEPRVDAQRITGSPGGTVLEPRPHFGPMVVVFDYRSLYPSIIRTFNIDPLAFQEARGLPDAECVILPDGCRFARGPAILPEFVATCFAERSAAIERGDERASQVYKILMNSFYGVLGSPGCRYGRRELASAITGMGAWCLRFARDWFDARGLKVLYGDTDSVFVESGLPVDAPFGSIATWAADLAAACSRELCQTIEATWRRPSSINLRFDKAYRMFFIPRIRSGEVDDDQGPRGRAKGYAGWLISADKPAAVDIKGMEAARSDVTPLSRRLQAELLELVFSSPPEQRKDAAQGYLAGIARELAAGRLDAELVLERRLRDAPERYTKTQPPHVRAARLAGMKGRGTIRYLLSLNGPEPEHQLTAPIDHHLYLETQVLPIAKSIGELAGFDAEALLFPNKQPELF